ncbi:sialate O-acetylesterase [Listeria welshimeri]|nr:sialate O-acetylesterase [Listeria welshimeri]
MSRNNFTLAPIFSDNMILQRDELVPFYGEAAPFSNVEVKAGDKIVQTTTDGEGHFTLYIGPFSAGEEHNFYFLSGDKTISLKNILFGDVYLAAGQSNIEFPLENDIEITKEELNWTKIRYYNVPQIEYSGHTMPKQKWQNANKDMSAVAYYFAVKMYQEAPEVPIGIIGCYKGGTSASCWIPKKILNLSKQLKKTYVEPFEKAVSNKTVAELEREREAFEQKSRVFSKRKEAFVAEHPELSLKEIKLTLGHSPWPPPMTPKSYGRPGGLYETMFRTIVRLRFKAVLWYQGEEDAQFGKVYEELLETLIGIWRKELAQPRLPFFVVQLPRYENAPKGSWPIIREIQANITKRIPVTYLVTSIDDGEAFDIHPPSKRVIGERLALITNSVLNRKMSGITPMIDSVNFPYVEVGNAKKLTIIGEYPFNIPRIEIHESKLKIPKTNIKTLKYAFENYPKGYLVNELGIPVSPFKVAIK